MQKDDTSANSELLPSAEHLGPGAGEHGAGENTVPDNPGADKQEQEDEDEEQEETSEARLDPGDQGDMVAASSGLPSPDGGSESDSESIYHQPIKEVDRPSASRLAKRLFHNDGFKKQDISRHLHKK